MAIRGVIFDFGGVLCFPPSDEKIASFAERLGVSVPVFLDAFWTTREEYDANRLNVESYWQGVAARAGVPYRASDLPDYMEREIRLWNHYDPRVFAWIAKLKLAGFKTGLLSNLPPDLGEALRLTPGFLDPFDHVTYSYEQRSVKPEPAIYKDAVQGIGLPAGECLFLDDRPSNVEGGRAAGIVSVVYENWEAFLDSGMIELYGLPRP